MNNPQLIRLICFSLILGTLVGCDCENPAYIKHDYSVCGIIVENLENGGNKPIVVNSGVVSRKAYGMRVHSYLKDGYTCQAQRAPLFINTASAFGKNCDEAYADFPAVSAIDSFHIRTLYDFNEDYLSGADVTSLFFRRQSNGDFYTADGDHTIFYGHPVDLLLMTAPEPGTEVRFVLNVYRVSPSNDTLFLTDTTALVKMI